MKRKSCDCDCPVVVGCSAQASAANPDGVASEWAIWRSVSQAKTMNWNCCCVADRKSLAVTTSGGELWEIDSSMLCNRKYAEMVRCLRNGDFSYWLVAL